MLLPFSVPRLSSARELWPFGRAEQHDCLDC
jgi:hypothetical protein